MKPSSAKAKGRSFQQLVRDAILATFPELEKEDVRSTSMGASGTDIQLSPRAKALFKYSVECKSLAKFVGYTYYDQAISGRERGTEIPIVAIKANGRKPLVILGLDDFLDLVKRSKE